VAPSNLQQQQYPSPPYQSAMLHKNNRLAGMGSHSKNAIGLAGLIAQPGCVEIGDRSMARKLGTECVRAGRYFLPISARYPCTLRIRVRIAHYHYILNLWTMWTSGPCVLNWRQNDAMRGPSARHSLYIYIFIYRYRNQWSTWSTCSQTRASTGRDVDSLAVHTLSTMVHKTLQNARILQ